MGGIDVNIVWSAQEVQLPESIDVLTSALVGGERVLVKIAAEAIADKGRARCFAKAESIIRAAIGTGELPKAIILSGRDFGGA